MTLISRLFAFLGALPRPVRVSAYLFFAASLAYGVLMRDAAGVAGSRSTIAVCR